MAELKITAEPQKGRTVLSSLYFTSPLKVAKPFYADGPDSYTKVMVMQASAGLLEGDRNEISLKLNEGARLEYTGQSFTKVFSSPEGMGSSQNVQIELSKNASLVYVPMPVVPFTGSVYKGETCIKLSESSKLFYSDIFCSGRKERGESFNFKSYVSRCRIYVDENLVFLDNARFMPEECSLESTGFFEGFSHTALIYLYGFELPDYSKLLSDQILCAHSKCQKGMVLRAFANGAEPLRLFIASLSEKSIDTVII